MVLLVLLRRLRPYDGRHRKTDEHDSARARRQAHAAAQQAAVRARLLHPQRGCKHGLLGKVAAVHGVVGAGDEARRLSARTKSAFTPGAACFTRRTVSWPPSSLLVETITRAPARAYARATARRSPTLPR